MHPLPDSFGACRPRLRVAVLMLTPACALRCGFCGADDAFDVMSWAQALALLEHLALRGVESVVLGGGEPLLWPHGLRALAAAARARGLLVQVGTSGHGFPSDAPAWDEVGRWVLPLESASAAVHDALRPGPAPHQAQVLAAMDRLQAAGRELTMSSVARCGGDADLEGVAALLQQRRSQGLRLHAWHLYRFQAMGRGGARHAGRFAMDDDGWKGLVDGLRRRWSSLPLVFRPDMMHSKQVAFFWADHGRTWQQGPLAYLAPLGAEPCSQRPGLIAAVSRS